MRMDPVHIALCCDLLYLQPLAVVIQSLVATAHDPRRLHLWIMTDTRDAARLEPAVGIARAAGARCTLLSTHAADALLRRAPTHGHLSTATYYRLFLPELLPVEVGRVIYLDTDIVVRQPIEELWDTDLEGHSLAAVQKPRAGEFGEVGLSRESDYFNAGVLLIDLPRWRKRRIGEAALEFALHRSQRIQGHDQSALNHVLAGNWKRLDPRWNQQFKFFVHTAGYLRMNRAELRELRRDPFIIHYTTASKPWHYLNDHPLRHCYYENLDRTPFAGWRPPPAAPLDPLVRSLRSLVPHYLRPGVLRNVYRPHYHALKNRLPFATRPHPVVSHE